MTELEQLEQALDVACKKLEASPKWKAWVAADKAYKAAIETRHPDQRFLCEAFWNALEKLGATPEYQAWEAVHKVYMAAKVKLEEGNE